MKDFYFSFPVLWQLLTDRRKLKNFVDVLEVHRLRLEEVREYPYFNVVGEED
jgi:hypothetical protein